MLTLKDICVNYSYKQVLKGISLSFQPGKVYSLLGENGAGKSTLAKVICGDIKPTSGSIYIDQKEVHFNSPHRAIQQGLVCVHQRPLLASSISIEDNLKIGISKKQMLLIHQLAQIWLPNKKLSTLVRDLNQTECFFVALIGALLKNPKVIIIDEPPELDTAALLAQQAKMHGGQAPCIIMITHNLKEALSKSDQVILLQDGLVLEEKPAPDFTEEEIQSKLYGNSKEVEVPHTISLLQIDENQVKHIPGKVGIIPSDKTFRASNPAMTILQLMTAYHPEGKQKDLMDRTQKLLDKAGVNIKFNEKVKALSGGMLQKLILERELAEKPESLYLFKATQGLDVEATERLYKRLDNLARNGTAVYLCSPKSMR